MKPIYAAAVIFSVLTVGITATYLNFNQIEKNADGFSSSVSKKYREFLSDYLWNRMDIYHHLWEFSGKAPSLENNSLFLIRAAALINPRNEKVYSLGAFLLYKFNGKMIEARDFLMEGLRNNPDSIRIWMAYANFLYLVEKDSLKAFHTGKRILRRAAETDLEGEEGITFVRMLTRAAFEHGFYTEANGYFAILSAMVNLNATDLEQMRIIKEYMNGKNRKKTED